MKKNLHSFRGGSGYIMIPLLGLALAGLVIFFAKDFFLGTKPPEYHKPEVTVERTEGPSLEDRDTHREISVTSPEGDEEPVTQTGSQQALREPDDKEANLAVPVSVSDNSALSEVEKGERDLKNEEGSTGLDQGDEVTGSSTSRADGPSPSVTENVKYQEDGTWGIQIGMFGRKSDAERLLKEVRDKGYNPEITRPGSYYRVRVNGGSSVETALALKKMLHDEGYDTLVVRSENTPANSGPVDGFSKYQQDDSWGVQIGMFPSRSDAQRLVSEVEKKGFSADITRPGNYYRVRVRAGSDEKTASRIQNLLAREGYETLLVRSAP